MILCMLRRAGALLLFAAAPASAQRTVDEYIRTTMAESQIPGLSLAVLKNGKLVKVAGYGLANVETGTPATAQTVYKAASLSKQFTAAAVVLLAQEGRLALDDRAAKYLSDAPEAWKDITIRQLLSHTSGLVRDPADYEPYRERPVADVIRSVYPVPLVAPPGEKFLYSNVGYYVLAEIVSRASGMPWTELVSRRLFGPAGMTATRPTTTTDIVPNRAHGYKRTATGLANVEDWIAMRPSAAFLSTVEDLAKWDVFLTQEPLRTIMPQLWTPATLTGGATSSYGFGWYVHTYLTRPRIHHDGQFPGFRSDYERFPADSLTVIVLTNLDNARVEWIALRVAGFYAPALATPRFTLQASAPAGRLASGAPVTVDVAATADRAAPESVLEIEIWDESEHSAYKANRTNESFAAGETRHFPFTFTPKAPGRYTVSVSAFGPRYAPPYTFAPRALVIAVE